MSPVTDDPLAWQGRSRHLFYPPGCGLIYFWCEYEMQRPENDETLAQNEDGASAVESATP
jgi:hypothetical protein